jgi:ketosteroid isomerase-like protein
MKKTILTSGILLALLVAPALNAWSQSEEEIKTKIEKINSKMAEAMVAGEYEKTLGLYAEDAISLPSYQPMLKGIEEIKKSSEEMAKSGSKVKSFEAHTKKVKICGDMVIEIGKYRISMEMPGMPDPVEDHGKYITIWEKQSDGSLKIKIDTWNTDVNPWAQGQE